jgi:hypothetical protein
MAAFRPVVKADSAIEAMREIAQRFNNLNETEGYTFESETTGSVRHDRGQ